MFLLIKYYFILLLCVFVFYFLGLTAIKLIKTPFENYTSYGIFFKIFIGIVVFTLISSIVFTKGKTVLVALIPLLVFIYFFRRRIDTPLEDKIYDPKPIRFIYAFLILSFIFVLIGLETHQGSNIFIPYTADYIYYSKVSYSLVHHGVENYWADPLFPNEKVTPYHYFELWLNGSISYIFQLSHLHTLLFITYPLLIFVTWLGFCAIAEYIHPQISYWLSVICFLCLFLKGFYFDVYKDIHVLKYASTFNISIWNQNKLTIVFIFLIACMLQVIKNKPNQAFFWLLCLPILYTPTAPAILSSLMFYLCIVFFVYKSHHYFIIQKIIASSIIIISLLVFYGLFSDTIQSVSASIDIFSGLKTRFNIIAGTLIQMFILYLPFCLMGFIFIKRIKSFFIDSAYTIIIPIILLFSLFTWAFFYKIPDSVQLFSNIALPICNTLMMIILVYAYKQVSKSRYKIIFQVGIMMICMVGVFKIYEKKINNPINTAQFEYLKNKIVDKNKIAVSFNHAKNYNSYFSKNTTLSFLGQYILYLFPNADTIDISIHQMNIDTSQKYALSDYELLTNSSFYKYVENQKKMGHFLTINQSQKDFIHENKIDYIITPKDLRLPKHLQEMVKEDFIFDNDKISFFTRN
ncbi:hypothetical protein AD998_15205 [bacterium 336/3]|nr:hypothetical protein AD998_15205 [bacterium 336/3]